MIKINKIQGFTLLELMITLAIAAIMVTIGIPSFMGLIRDSRMTTNANDFFTALSYARSEAAMRNVEVIIQSKSSVDLDWKDGWDVYIDTDDSGDFDIANDELLKTHDALPNRYTLTANSGFNTKISYQPTGLMSTSFNGRFYLCLDGDVASSREIVINSLGRARIDAPATTCS
ncbi:MAG: pilus assembly protein FimT [Methylophaga sp.]|nr:MAG: pilus assembly protein FimT [Methylophaga sp.]